MALSAGTFTLMHMQYPAPILLLVLMLGVVLGYARSRTGSIWVPVGLHMLNNLVSLAIA
ncbi:MAG: CPBP family intramembrane metalloprotease [Flavobacteriales bacterium]|nr:CPBP family intramembrane metalloprotease [Flavobacteriales bacterium]